MKDNFEVIAFNSGSNTSSQFIALGCCQKASCNKILTLEFMSLRKR